MDILKVISKSLPDYLPEEVKSQIAFYALACPHQPKSYRWALVKPWGGTSMRNFIYEEFKLFYLNDLGDICHRPVIIRRWASLINDMSIIRRRTNKELWEELQNNHIGKIPNKSKIKTKKQLIQALMAI